MRRELMVAAAGAGVIGLLAASSSADASGRRPEWTGYPKDAHLPYGGWWRERRPPGFPLVTGVAVGDKGTVRVDGLGPSAERQAILEYARRHGERPRLSWFRVLPLTSKRGAATQLIQQAAGAEGLGEAFVTTMLHLAQTESGRTFRLPANNFDAQCRSAGRIDRRRMCVGFDEPRGQRGLITAAGVYQWNRDAGRDLGILDRLGLEAPPIAKDWMPWDWTADEEVRVPIDYYAQLWRLVARRRTDHPAARGRSPKMAARGIRLWHTSPVAFAQFVRAGATQGAWRDVNPRYARRIDSHIRSTSLV